MYKIGDKIMTKKAHPCGGDTWEIVRVGADIKIKCLTCGHMVMVPLDKFPRLVKKVLD